MDCAFPGVESSSPDAAVGGAFADAVFAVAAHRPEAGGALARALAADPAHVGALVLRGFAGLVLARPDLLVGVEASLAAARASLAARGGGKADERRLTAALAHAVGGSFTGARGLRARGRDGVGTAVRPEEGRMIRAIMTAAAALAASGASAAGGERVRLAGEVIDTWCYLSGVMGGPEAVVGSAHHTCALWCAAGGIPVGVLGDDGVVYFLLKWEGGDVVGSGALLDAQSARVTVDGELHRRDGLNYLLVSAVASNEGITARTHEEWGVVPPFAFPEVEP